MLPLNLNESEDSCLQSKWYFPRFTSSLSCLGKATPHKSIKKSDPVGWSGSQLQNKESKGYDSFGNKSWIIKNSEILSWLKFVKGVKLERLVAWLNATRKGYEKEYVGVRCVEGLGKRGLSLSLSWWNWWLVSIQWQLPRVPLLFVEHKY